MKPPTSDRIEYFDSSFGGLALRVTENGHKSWSLHYRSCGRLRRYTLGNYPAITAKNARRAAQEALDKLRDGIDPAEQKRVQRNQAAGPDDVAAAAYDYLARLKRNIADGSYREAKRILERDVLKHWRDRTLASITRGDVNQLIDRIIARGADVHANRVLARLRAFFNWTVERGRLPASPIAGMKPPTKERPRDRVLSDDELRWWWHACDVIDWPFGPLTKLLLLTAQRRDEVARLEWLELDLKRRTWTIPREKAKNDRAHEIQLSDAAIDVLKSLPRIADDLIFTTTGETVVSGFSRAKARLDAEMVKARRQSLGLPEDDKAYRKTIRLPAAKPLPVEIPPWILHDLRRTAATGMARLNYPPHVVDKVLNHVSGTIRGVAAVYNRFEYLEERRAALEAWGRHVAKLAAPTSANVLPLRA